MAAPEQLIEWWLLTRQLLVRREFHLPDGGRLDLAGLKEGCRPVGVEVKRSLRDWHRDLKWPRYLPFCYELWVAFPEKIMPPLVDPRLGLLAWRDHTLLIVRPAIRLRSLQ